VSPQIEDERSHQGTGAPDSLVDPVVTEEESDDLQHLPQLRYPDRIAQRDWAHTVPAVPGEKAIQRGSGPGRAPGARRHGAVPAEAGGLAMTAKEKVLRSGTWTDQAALSMRVERIVDLSGLDFIDSTGLGALVQAHRSDREDGNRLRSCVDPHRSSASWSWPASTEACLSLTRAVMARVTPGIH
jgi:hypothetical protein